VRALIQRVSEASVSVDGAIVGAIGPGPGLLVLLGIEDPDTEEDSLWLAGKIARMRIFSDEAGHMNLSSLDVSAGALVVSQFTLHASTKKGNRPSFIRAARPEKAIPLYERFLSDLSGVLGVPVACGKFGAEMKVSLVNDGPVTIWMDSKSRE
jgi:D-tyrosyl-tRNA(Tyr) deacylase